MINKIKKYWFEITLFVFIIVMYRNYFPVWIYEWADLDSFYAFGFFMVGFLIYLAYTKKDNLIKIPKTNDLSGIILLLIGILLYCIGIKATLDFLVGISLPLVIGGTVLIMYGRKLFLYILLPLVLFAFALPIFPLHRLTMPLQMLSAKMSSGILNFLGVSAINEGNIMYVENYRISVTPGCSGLKSVYSIFFISIIYSYFVNAKLFKKLSLIALSLPLALSLNIIRITLVGFYAMYQGYEGIGKFHDNLGLVFYVLAIGIVFMLFKFIENEDEELNEV